MAMKNGSATDQMNDKHDGSSFADEHRHPPAQAPSDDSGILRTRQRVREQGQRNEIAVPSYRERLQPAQYQAHLPPEPQLALQQVSNTASDNDMQQQQHPSTNAGDLQNHNNGKRKLGAREQQVSIDGSNDEQQQDGAEDEDQFITGDAAPKMYGMQRQQQPTTLKDQPIHDNLRAKDVTGNEGADTAYHGLQMLDVTMRAIQECMVENTKKLDTLLCMFSSQPSSQPAKKQKTQHSQTGKGTPDRSAESGYTRTKELNEALQIIKDFHDRRTTCSDDDLSLQLQPRHAKRLAKRL